MGILYIRPLHFPNKEKSFCTKPIFLFKSNTMLQTNILDIDDLFCTLDTLVGVHVVAMMLQTKEPVLGTGKTDHSKNSNSSTQHSSTGKTRTPADTEQLDHRVFRLTPTVSIIFRPTPSRKQVRVYRWCIFTINTLLNDFKRTEGIWSALKSTIYILYRFEGKLRSNT